VGKDYVKEGIVTRRVVTRLVFTNDIDVAAHEIQFDWLFINYLLLINLTAVKNLTFFWNIRYGRLQQYHVTL
jgi:hypothetical protein